MSATGLNRALRRSRREAESGRGVYEALARAGLVAKGVSYGLVGGLAIAVAAGTGGETTSRQGALQALARHGYGKVLLVLLAIGFAAYALWRFVQALTEREEDEKKAWAKRVGYVGRGLVYSGLTFSAAKILAGSGAQQSQNGKAHKTTAVVLSWPGGTWLVGIAGVVLVGVGLWNAYRGVARKFEDAWRSGAMTGRARRWGARARGSSDISRVRSSSC